jgi:hypothetical protein
MKATWVDNRLDDLARRMDRGFDRVDTDLREIRSEMNSRFTAVDARFDAMQRTMIVGFASIVGSIVASVLAGILATQL